MRLTRFGTGYNGAIAAGNEQAGTRVQVFQPNRGFNRSDSALDLEPGYSPSMYNFVIDAGKLRPRSGISNYKGGVSGVDDAVLHAWRMNDHVGNQYLLGASSNTLVVYDPTPDSWSTLSYQRPAGWASDQPASGTSRSAWDGAWVYDAASDRNIAALTNQDGIPLEMHLGASIATYSNLTDFRSLASKARAVCNADDRLVWWNCATSGNSYPTRVMWSARGLPKNYQIADGAGFRDLLDMTGVGTRVVTEREGILLFTDEEIWRGRIRRDAYVFDFYPIEKHFGAPFPRTVVSTPIGCVFLGKDLELYVVRGDEVQALGPAAAGEASRVQAWLGSEIIDTSRTWATYNALSRRYELYYAGTDSANGYASRALFYAINENAFLPQRLNLELSAGAEYYDSGDPLLWSELGADAWEEVATSWGDQFVPGVGSNIYGFTSAGTGVRFYASATDDMGVAFDTLWQSHAILGLDGARQLTLTESWFDVEASGSTVTVRFANESSNASRAVYLNGNTRVRVPQMLTGAAPNITILGTGGDYKFARMQARVIDAGSRL